MAASLAQPGTPSLEIELQADAEAPSVARAALTGFSENRGLDDDQLALLVLLTSEVVTNAVVHPDAASHTIRVCASLHADRIRVEVVDRGSGFTPTPRDPARTDGGYGLFLVESQALDWGVSCDRGTTVWFELEA